MGTSTYECWKVSILFYEFSLMLRAVCDDEGRRKWGGSKFLLV